MLEILKSKNVLFVEDNEEFAQNFIALLSLFVKEVIHCSTLNASHEALKTQKVDMVICDIKLNNENGLDFIESARKSNGQLPMVILSGNKNEEFLFRAIPLNLVAYLLKPVKYKELIDTLNKCAACFKPSNHVVLKNGYIFDQENRMLQNPAGLAISLSKKESAFVELLVAHPNRIVPKEMMYESVWNFDYVSDQAVVNFIMRFRKKVGKDFIQTVPEAGYRLGG
ncbi:MAG: response regulator transcription factor [Campylobacterales bacterium]|nr:response regulator transcription factor [Campylobacterales bacterium]